MGKVTEMQGKLEHSIPKLPDDATDEDVRYTTML